MWNDWEENTATGEPTAWYRETDDGLSALYVDPRPYRRGHRGYVITLEYDQDGKTRTKKLTISEDVTAEHAKGLAMALDAGTKR